MEIERKFLLKKIPEHLDQFAFHIIEQAYLNTSPVIRIRKEDDHFYLTYKGSGVLAREEYNLPLNEASYQHLLPKSDGNVISKKRYLIPLSETEINSDCLILLNGTRLVVELDEFAAPFAPLLLAEIEFPSVEAAEAFELLPWFSEDVTSDSRYHNSHMSRLDFSIKKADTE